MRARYLRPASTRPFLGNTLDFVHHHADLHDWFLSQAEAFQGKTFLLTCLGRHDMLLASSPAVFEDVYKSQFEGFEKGPVTCEQMRDFFGGGIFCVDGAQWYRQRKTASHLFTMRALRDSMTGVVRAKALVLADILQRAADSGGEVDLKRLLNRFTIEVFTESALGVTMNGLDTKEDPPFQLAVDRALQAIVARFFCPPWQWKLMRWLGMGMEGQLKRDMEVINTLIYGIINKSLAQRQQPQDQAESEAPRKADLISLFLDSPNYQQDFGQEGLRDVVLSFVLAGRDSTSQSLSWFFRALTMHPEVEKKSATKLNNNCHICWSVVQRSQTWIRCSP